MDLDGAYYTLSFDFSTCKFPKTSLQFQLAILTLIIHKYKFQSPYQSLLISQLSPSTKDPQIVTFPSFHFVCV